mmetsp:Transcript_54873/g.134488  ORF Transcript_54873/g.134488 Transcript_54873/m.134488 type:complete len:355 (+) Transcript_54873:476-1540(+)
MLHPLNWCNGSENNPVTQFQQLLELLPLSLPSSFIGGVVVTNFFCTKFPGIVAALLDDSFFTTLLELLTIVAAVYTTRDELRSGHTEIRPPLHAPLAFNWQQNDIFSLRAILKNFHDLIIAQRQPLESDADIFSTSSQILGFVSARIFGEFVKPLAGLTVQQPPHAAARRWLEAIVEETARRVGCGGDSASGAAALLHLLDALPPLVGVLCSSGSGGGIASYSNIKTTNDTFSSYDVVTREKLLLMRGAARGQWRADIHTTTTTTTQNSTITSPSLAASVGSGGRGGSGSSAGGGAIVRSTTSDADFRQCIRCKRVAIADVTKRPETRGVQQRWLLACPLCGGAWFRCSVKGNR